jgi:hypothetical protein
MIALNPFVNYIVNMSFRGALEDCSNQIAIALLDSKPTIFLKCNLQMYMK